MEDKLTQSNELSSNLQLARKYKEKKKFKLSFKYYELALRQKHTDANLWLEYADVSVVANNYTVALNLLHNGKLELKKTLSKVEYELYCKKANSIENKVSTTLNPSNEKIEKLNLQYSKHEDVEETIYSCLATLRRYPNSYLVHNILGAVYNSANKIDLAARSYKNALDIYPNFTPSLINLANLYTKIGKTDKALKIYQKALMISPNNFDALNNFGIMLVKTNPMKAIELLKLAVKIRSNSATAWNSLGTAYHALQLSTEALQSYKTSLKYKPNYADCLNNIGVLLSNQGKFSEANKYYNKALECDPGLTSAYRHLAMNKAIGSHIEKLEELYASLENLGVMDQANVCFALALINEDKGNYSKTVELLKQGGRYRRQELNYRFENEVRAFTAIRETPILLPKHLNFSPEPTNVPIFIVGMPRSGTSLVEQIISSHSKVAGLGELGFVNNICRRMFDKGHVTGDELQYFRSEYLKNIQLLNSTNLFLTDKMPQNFLYLGMISKALPEAKIVHVQRNGAAVCWSNFKQYFASNSMGYSYDLDDTVTYFQMYKELMSDWEAKIGSQMYNLNYEKLVDHPDIEISRLLDFIGLEQEEACFAPHKNARNVSTASQRQVRRKIYKGSSQAWEKFKPYLGDKFSKEFTS